MQVALERWHEATDDIPAILRPRSGWLGALWVTVANLEVYPYELPEFLWIRPHAR